MLNRFVGMGRITRDLEPKTTPSGVNVLSFTIACDRDIKQGGEKVTDFIDCVAWRHNADFLAKYAGKGRLVCVEGNLQSRKWQDKDGNNRTSWEVQIGNVYLCDRKPDGNTAPTPGGFGAIASAAQSAGVPVYSAPSAAAPAFSADVTLDDEDVPF